MHTPIYKVAFLNLKKEKNIDVIVCFNRLSKKSEVKSRSKITPRLNLILKYMEMLYKCMYNKVKLI